MKRFTRAIALCLVLALMLTAFGMLATFADDSAADDGVDYGTVMYDMNVSTPTLKNDKGITTLTKTEVDGQKIYTMAYKGASAGLDPVSGDYLSMSEGWANTTRVRDDATRGEKNVDYIVLDFDIATDTEFIDNIYFNTRIFASGSTTSIGKAAQYPAVWRDEDGGLYVANGDGKNKCYPAFDSGNKWTNITFVFDFSHVDENGKNVNYTYVYIDGIFCGNLTPYISTTAAFNFLRLHINETGTKEQEEGRLTYANASTSIANYTVKKFGTESKGVMYKEGVLGSIAMPLYNIPELAYCLEDLPENPEGYQGIKIADIKRGGETIEVYSEDDLCADLIDGDVVTVYKDLKELIIYKEGDNITVTDVNGTPIGAEGCLVSSKGTHAVSPETDWVVLRGGAYYASGKASDIFKTNTGDLNNDGVIGTYYTASDGTEGYSYVQTEVYDTEVVEEATTTDRLIDPLYVALSDSSLTKVILLGDVTSYGKGAKSTGSSTTSSKGAAKGVVFDVNGHNLVIAPTGSNAHYFSFTSGSKLTIKNGNFKFAGAGGNLAMIGSQNTSVIFDNVPSLQIVSGTIFDQRGGLLMYRDCNVTGSQAISNSKSSGLSNCTLLIDNTDIDVTGVAISISNVASSSMRQGSLNNYIQILNGSNVKSTGNTISVDAYGNATGTYTDNGDGTYTFVSSKEAYSLNDNNLEIIVSDSHIETASTVLFTNVSEFRAKGSVNKKTVYVDANEQFSLDVNVAVTNSTLSGKYLHNQSCGGYKTTLAYADNYTYNTVFDLTDTDLYISNTDNTLVSKVGMLPSQSVTINTYGEFGVHTDDTSKYFTYSSGVTSSANDSFNLTEYADHVWMPRSLEGAPKFSYTNNIEYHAYIYNGHEYEFMTYLGDPVTAANIPATAPLPETSDMLKYQWVYNTDGAYEAGATYIGPLKANLTVEDDLTLNVYIPATFGDRAYEHVFAGGVQTPVYDVTYNDVAYKAVKFAGIDPSSASKDVELQFRVVDELGRTEDVTVEISVLDYIESALTDENVTESGKLLVASLLNYLVKADSYNNAGAQANADLLALTELDEYKSLELVKPELGEKKLTVSDLGIFSSARLVLGTKFAYEFRVADGFEGEITLTYDVDNVSTEKTLSVVGGDVVTVEFYAYELVESVIVTYGDASGEFNLAGYFSLIPENSSAELVALIEAIQIYTAAAQAFVG